MAKKNVKEFIVKGKRSGFSGKDLVIPYSKVKEIGASLVLKKGVEIEERKEVKKETKEEVVEDLGKGKD